MFVSAQLFSILCLSIMGAPTNANLLLFDFLGNARHQIGMRIVKVEPDSISYNSVASGYAEKGQVQQAVEWLLTQPYIITCNFFKYF